MKSDSVEIPYQIKRNLVPFDLQIPKKETDVLVIGSGVAGLRAAIECSKKHKVVIVTKSKKAESNSLYAQGGVAAAIFKDDSVSKHTSDTLRVGGELSEKNLVENFVKEGVERAKELLIWGARFDERPAREGGHSLARILHRGDETGQEIQRVLLEMVNCHILENTFTVDLIVRDRRCYGAILADNEGKIFSMVAKKTILASGGLGQVYRETTNPAVATGDGIAVAFRSGVTVQDMEFVQFHPTALYIAGASRALISEAVRGAGAVLRDKSGRAFMKDYDPVAELAPRDKVSRSILEHMIKTDDTQVYLDVRHISAVIKRNFPALYSICNKFNINPAVELIPVRPAAHYMIGGIKTDEYGRTDCENLYACGECASTGVHGANRLGSNSLLECLVFANRVAEDACSKMKDIKLPDIRVKGETESVRELDLEDIKNSLKSLMWRNAGIIRDKEGLEEAIEKLLFWSRYSLDKNFDNKGAWELQNMLINSLLICTFALERTESRGVHFRKDFPLTDKKWERHITARLQS